MKPLVVIPTYNERENIRELIPEILSLAHEFHVLIVDDNSPDGTGKLADALAGEYPGEVHVLHRERKEGLGRAYLAGFGWALAREYDPIFEMDADFSHDPRYLSAFLKHLEKHDHDVVVGSRWYDGRLSAVNWDFKRVLLSRLGSIYARLVTGVPVSDATAGFKCFRRRVLERVGLENVLSEGYSFQIEMNWRAHQAGFRIGEIPTIFYERRHGSSKMSGSIIREALWILWKMKVRK